MGFSGTRFSVNDLQLATWNELFPGVDVSGEVCKAHAWLLVNNKRKRDYERYVFRWLKRAHNDLLKAEVIERVRTLQRRKDAMVGRAPGYGSSYDG
jgi:hypothetical protein